MPVPIPASSSTHDQTKMSWSSYNSISSSESSSSSYPEIIRELASKTPKPYGTIPPRRRKRRRKSIIYSPETSTLEPCSPSTIPPIRMQRRMSHVEDWEKVDSKEPLPDDDELTSEPSLLSQLFSSSAFQGAHVLPLHVPPPNMSNPIEFLQEQNTSNGLYGNLTQSTTNIHNRFSSSATSRAHFWDSSSYNSNTRMLSGDMMEEYDEEDDFDHAIAVPMEDVSAMLPWAGEQTKARPVLSLATAIAKRPLSSSRSPLEWLTRLRKSISMPAMAAIHDTPNSFSSTSLKETDRSRKWAAMPPPPKRLPRRSVATSEPRIDLHSNTIRRDIRANPDHLRMIVAELNMMRARKVMCPLKPRGFLPRRKDIFVRGLSGSSLKYTEFIVDAQA